MKGVLAGETPKNAAADGRGQGHTEEELETEEEGGTRHLS